MANQNINMRVKYSAEFDTSKISEGLKDIKKQVTNANISDELKKQFEAAFNKIQVNIPALEKLTSKEDFNLKDIEALQKLLKEVTKDWENLNKVTDQIDLSKTFSAQDIEKINNLDKQIKQTQDNIQKARKELVDAFTNDTKISVANKNVSDALTELFTVKPTEIDSKFKEIQSQFSEGVQQTQTELKNKLENANIQKTGGSIIDYFFGKDSGVDFANKVGPVKEQINEIIRKYREFKQANDEAGMAEQIQKLNQVLTDTANFKFPEGYELFGLPTQEDLDNINKIGESLDEIKKRAKEKEPYFTEQEANNAQLLEQHINLVAQATKNASENQKQFKQNLNNTGNGIKDFNDKANQANEELRRLQRQGEALEQTFGSLANRITNSVSALTVFNKSTQIIRNAIRSVEDLDAAFTQIAIVSEQSNEAAWKMFDSFNKLAKQYSITTKDLTEGAKLFYQQGLNAADTMKMVEASTISAALGEVTMTEAANTLTAAIQGYNESAAVAMDYTDKIAMVGAVSAADFNELSAAMEKTASSAYTAGIDFDHLLGYLGKMIEVTREAPANLGTAMKTIIARFEDMKKDPMAILEDGVSANKVEAALSTIGIALRDSEGEFRALQDVFDELGIKWNTLTRNQQAYIATVAAGSRQQSRFLAMMNNYDRTLDLITESQNSAGAAAQQYSIYQDSIAAAQARLTASWENFYSKIVDNDLIKNGINGLSRLIDIISDIPPIITAIGASIGALALQNVFKLITSSQDGMVSTIQRFKDMYNTSKEGKATFEQLKIMSPKITNGFKSIGVAAQGIFNTIKGGISTLTAFITTNIQFIAIAVAVGLAIYGITRALTAQQRAYEENIEKIKAYTEKAEKYKTKADTGDNLIKNYKELSTKINRTTEEQNELNNTIREISNLYPDAITYMDQYGNMHLENSKQIENEIKDTRELYKEQKKLALLARQSLITGDDRRNKEEDFEAIGYSSAATQRYFYYKNRSDETYDANVGVNSFKANMALSGLYRFKNLPKEADASENTIKDINNAIDLLGLSLEKLDKYSTWEEVFDKADEIEKARKKLSNEASMYREELEKAKLQMQRETKMEFAFLDLDYSSKEGTATGQQAIAAELKQYFSSLGDEAYKSFEDSLGKETLSDYIQKAINKIDNTDEAIDAKNLIQEALDPTTSEDRLQEIYGKLGNLLGNEFVDNFEISIEAHKKEIRDILENTIRDQFGNTPENLSEYSNEKLSRINELGNKYGVEDFDEAENLDSFYNQAKELQKDAIKAGSIEGLEDSLKEIDLSELSEKEKEQAEKIIQDILDGTIPAIVDGSFDKLQSRAAEYLDNSKKQLGKISSEGRVTAKDYGLDDNDYSFGVYFDTASGEKMVSTTRVLNDLQKENNALMNDTKLQIKNIEEEIKRLEKKGKDRNKTEDEILRNYKREKDVLEDQLYYYEKMNKQYNNAGWDTSIQLAKNYQTQLKTIDSLEEKLSKQNNKLYVEDMEEAMSILPEFQNRFTKVSDGIYTITAENLGNMRQEVKKNYDYWLATEREKALTAYENAVLEYETLKQQYGDQIGWQDEATDSFIRSKETEVIAAREELGKILNTNKQEVDKESAIHAEKDNNLVIMFRKALNQMGTDYETFLEGLRSGNPKFLDEVYNDIQSKQVEGSIEIDIDTNLEGADKALKEQQEKNALIAAMLEESAAKVKSTWQQYENLQEIDVPELSKLEKSLEGSGKSADELEKKLKAVTDAIEELLDAAKELDDLLKDVKKELKDIDVDYNPFTDLFEAWEHEWDYYYNIKRLLQQIDTQGQYIDNIISADYISADKRIEAEHAKVGNLLAKMSANDTYIEALRAGMSQTAVELMKDYGEYYKVDPTTGQLYQTDKNLNDINELMNERKQEIYDLQKLQNEKENDLNLENAKLEALGQEKSAYEDILSTIESQYDSLKDNEDITVDISGLEKEKTELEAKIKITDESIEAQKDKIRKMEDDIQDIEVGLTLKDQDFQKLEDYVSDMEDKVSEYKEYWENLNSTIAEQQELLSNLNELYKGYVDTAISTQQELYDAIVENYQDEINQKKKQYDYLKQLDNDYLQSVKDNVNKERQAREDANKQKSYQQNVQRAQLLQMDTSGAYRNELANLNKEIENQRQDLYDDLVDKQVEALEKEIDKRHELYDKEVAALEERLAYYQENAILLWEMVNSIVAEGANVMMATLENTTAYINSNELAKDQQRQTWEYNVQKTFDGVQNHTIDTLNNLIQAGNDFVINKYPEIGTALDDYKQVFVEASDAVNEYNSQLISSRDTLNNDTERATQVFQGILDSFMTTWNDRTNEFTGYAQNWVDVTSSLKQQTEDNLSDLRDLYDEQGNAIEGAIGSIQDYDQSLRDASAEIYQDFLDERRSYREELETLVNQIQRDISAAIGNAATAIEQAAANISVSPDYSGGNDGTPTSSSGSSGYGDNIEEPNQYKITGQYRYIEESGQERTATKTLDGFDSREEAIEALYAYLRGASKGFKWRSYNLETYGISAYEQGGLASFTGPAWLDGTKSKPERVLSPKQTKLFESMISSLERTANNSNINSPFNSSYNIGDINTTIQVEKLDNETDIEKVARQVENRIMKTIRNRVSISVA